MKLLSILFLLTFTLLAETYIVHNSSIVENIKTVNTKPIKLIKKDFLLTKFSKLNLNLPATFILNTHSDKNVVTLSIDEHFLDAIDIYIKNQRLYIASAKSIRTSLPIKIIIDCKDGIEEIVMNSSVGLDVNNLNETNLKLSLKGINKTNFYNGKIDNLTIYAEGNYEVNLNEVKIKQAFIEAKGIGKIDLSVSTILNVNLAGLVKVYYLGQPIIEQSLKGLSKLERR